MPRRYTRIKGIEPEIFVLKDSGKTNREIAETFGLELKQVKWLISRHNKAERLKEQGIFHGQKDVQIKGIHLVKKNRKMRESNS